MAKFKSLFSRRLMHYYLQQRLFQVNIEVRIQERYVFMDETVLAHSGTQAAERACKKVRDELNIRSVGYRCLGKPDKLKNIRA